MRSKKFKSVSFNNRKKQITVTYTSGKTYYIHYSSLSIKQNIKDIWIDKETRGQSLGIQLADNSIDYMPYDQPLAITQDSDYILQNQIEVMISQIKDVLKKKKVSKKYLARQLNTSDNQIQRLLNPKILNKNLTQLYKMAALLGLQLELNLQEAA